MKTQKSGQAALIATVLMMVIMISAVFGVSAVTLKEAKVAEENKQSKQTFFAAESGAEDAVYRLKRGKNLTSSFSIALNGATTTTTVTTFGSTKTVKSTGQFVTAFRASSATLSNTTGASFHYGVQIGNGGLEMENTSKVIGSVYSNGDIEGENSPVVTGDALLAGSSQASGVTVQGATLLNQPILSMPISDAKLDEWESDAAAGGSVTCSGGVYEPDNGDSIGPKKVPCDMTIDGTKVITITGTLWVEGNFDIKNSAQLKLSSSFGSLSGVVIVDKPSYRTTSSKITVQNSAQILGSGAAGSYVLVVSRNNSAENSGNEDAIDIKNSSAAPIYYAPHGSIAIQNSAALKEATGYKLEIKNSATVTYESGLANVNFTSGPSGGWDITSWGEVVP